MKDGLRHGIRQREQREQREVTSVPNCSCGARARWTLEPAVFIPVVAGSTPPASIYSCDECLAKVMTERFPRVGVLVYPVMGKDGRQVRKE